MIHPLAIGFEAPLFIPTPSEAMRILSGRRGEGSRPWSAGAGAAVTTAALAVVTYTLAGLRRGVPNANASVDINHPPQRPGDLLTFEAFVTASAKGVDHADDALIAAREASVLLGGDRAYRSAIDEPEVFSLLGAALLRTGWTHDLTALSAPCLVVKPALIISAPRACCCRPTDQPWRLFRPVGSAISRFPRLGRFSRAEGPLQPCTAALATRYAS